MQNQLTRLGDAILLVYGTDYYGLTAIDTADGAIRWNYVIEDALDKRISSVSIGNVGIFATAITDEGAGGRAVLLTKRGEIIWQADLPRPAFLAKILTISGQETYWCIAGIGQGIGPEGGNTSYQVVDGIAQERFLRASYHNAASLQVIPQGLPGRWRYAHIETRCSNHVGAICGRG